MTGTFEHFDARPGGSYRLILSYVDATESRGKTTENSDIVDARFVEIVPNARVVQAVEFNSDDPSIAGTMTMTWDVVRAGDGTQVEIRAENVPSGISRQDHLVGLNSSLANLAEYTER